MPLDFNKPRPKSSLSRPRDRRDVDAMTRDRFPRTEIILGLRHEGGYWTTRTHQEMERIKRHVDEMKSADSIFPSQPSDLSLYPPGAVPTYEEFEALVEAAVAGVDFYLHREADPEISVHPDHRTERMILRVNRRRPGGPATSMVINRESLRSAASPRVVVAEALEESFRKLYLKNKKIEIEQH